MNIQEELEFLKQLQTQMKYEDEHDYDCQASPRFWVVMDYKDEACWEEHAEEWVIQSPDACLHYAIDADVIKELIDEHQLEGEAVEILEEIGGMDDDEVLEWFQEYIDQDAYLVPQRQVGFIVPDTMFLTKEEAKRHIEGNRHHYTSKAHTYAMTAWRAPKVERLINFLLKCDFELLEVAQ